MENTRRLNRTLETIAWGVFFVWWGIAEMKFLPHGIGNIGVGLVMLGLNAARSLSAIPTSGFSTTLGFIMLAYGSVELAGTLFRLPFTLPTFSILLVVLGIVVLARATLQTNAA
jgi:hypothetical protein